MATLPSARIGMAIGVEWIGVLGEGSFGKVFKARDTETGNVS